jgi:phospholipid/cholesterol/gamma-HCH transport system substrate-binding protein
MAQQSTLAVKAGIVIVAGLVLFIGFSLRSTGRGWFYKGYSLTADFETAKGLEPGSQVVLAGVPVGKVESLELMPGESKVRLHLLIDAGNPIAKDSTASIRLKTLLGNYHLYLTHGSPGSLALAEGDALATSEYKDLTDTLADLGQSATGGEGLFGSLQANSESLFKKLESLVDENRENLLATTKAFADAGPKFNVLMDNMTSFSQSLENGEGTIGKLAKDDALYAQIQGVVGNLENFSSDLNASSGTLGRLVHDRKLGDQVAMTFENASAATGKVRGIIERNEGQIDSALKSAGTALPKFDQGMESFVSIGRKIDQGEGTLGKLINDPELYNSLRDAVNQIRRTFEEGEEQSVMRTFLGVFFGSVI